MYTSARELFEAAREASVDVLRIGRQVAELEARATATGGGIVTTTGHAHHQGDNVGRIVAAQAQTLERLAKREEEDYRLIDAACAVLYGSDGTSDGLYALVGWPADAIWWHFLGLKRWEDVAALVGFDTRWTQAKVRQALELADSNGMLATVAGIGMAEG